ncbi:MAG: hypothetical protein HYX20_01390 [Candidatus Yanofskybacteria bacterium]|nr:hypothetical protein [Candidatus Yanofskybacteria bacterium]
MRKYVENLEKDGHNVYWPARDTDQTDTTGLRICKDNRKKIKWADKVHIWWSMASEGSLFDFGMAFMAGKKIVLANPQDVAPTPKKSFTNVLLLLSNNYRC